MKNTANFDFWALATVSAKLLGSSTRLVDLISDVMRRKLKKSSTNIMAMVVCLREGLPRIIALNGDMILHELFGDLTRKEERRKRK